MSTSDPTPVELCEVCGEPGVPRVDPYRYQMFDEQVEMVLCDDDYYQRWGDA